MRCRAHVPFGLHSIHTHAVDNTCVASYTHTLFDMWLCPICLCFVTGLLHRAITCSTAHFQKLLQCPVARFQLYPCMQLAAREAAVDKIWDSAVVESANSLINFSLYFEEDDGQAGVSAQWHAQGNNTQTHSVVILCASCLHARIVL